MEESKSEEYTNKTDYYQALDEYFSLKKEYEDSFKNKIKDISKRNIPKQEKKKSIKKLKKNIRCINCGNIGGTYFGISTQDDGTKEYVAMCLAHRSDEGQQCGLDIRLKRGKIININQKEVEVNKQIEEVKSKIIIGKLSLLFDLENEDVALKEFDDLKSDLEKYSDQLKLIEEKNSENFTVKIINKDSDPEIISKKLYIKQLKTQLDKHIYKYKSIVLLSKTEEDFKKKGYLRDAYRFSIDTIMPLIDKIRSSMYQISMVETNEKDKTQFDPLVYTSFHKEVSYENDELIADEYAIIENIKE